jgi:predicted Zn-ribbon and HTH transcriptional regulator
MEIAYCFEDYLHPTFWRFTVMFDASSLILALAAFAIVLGPFILDRDLRKSRLADSSSLPPVELEPEEEPVIAVAQEKAAFRRWGDPLRDGMACCNECGALFAASMRKCPSCKSRNYRMVGSMRR